MIVISLSNIPPKLRGFLTKYLWEISAGVYVGDVNARIREAIWTRVLDNTKDISRAVMAFPADNEQGFDFLSIGPSWKPVNYEGLKLIMRPNIADDNGVRENNQNKISNEYVVLDLETTGLDVNNDRILEIGAIKIRGGIITDKFNVLIKTDVPSQITELTGITQEQADQGIGIKDALIQLKEFINNNLVVGYNIRMFDLRFIKKECVQNAVALPFQKIEDVLDMVRKVYPKMLSYQLREIAKIKNISVDEKHRALLDCELCNKIYCMCNGVDLSEIN